MTAIVLAFPRNDLERKAVDILRVRNTPNNGGYKAEEIQWAVEVIRQWDPNHPLLRYSERK